MFRRLTAACLFATFSPATLQAQSCEAVLAPPSRDQSVTIRVATMNTRGVVSYAFGELEYHPALIDNGYRIRPGYWDTYGSPALQVFSDRADPYARTQWFALSKADRVYIRIPEVASPAIEFTLRSWGNARLTFAGACSSNGIIRGTSGDTDVLIYLLRGPRR